MKAIRLSLLAVLAVTLVDVGFAKDPAEQKGGQTKTKPWNVRVEVLMVSMPQDKALSLLPDLRDQNKAEAAFTQILNLISLKEATLLGYPMVVTGSGQRAVSEVTEEKRYPTEFGPLPAPGGSKGGKAPEQNLDVDADISLPTAFETRNLGVTLEVEATVSENGDWIALSVGPQRVALLGFDSYDAVKTQDGRVGKVDQPRFFSTRTTTAVRLRNGQLCLLAVNKLPGAESQIELFILRATATSAK